MNADVIVVGLGAMGASAAYQLVRRGASVLGIDRFAPPHSMGSTHGDTRITRQATVEGASYVPLAVRSQQIWRELEDATGRELLTTCGILQIAPAGAVIHGARGLVEQSAAFAAESGIAHDMLDAASLRERFPQFMVSDEHVGYFEPGAGYVRPEACVAAQLELAEAGGARLLLNTTVASIETTSGGVAVVTASGERHEATSMILATGQWIGALGGEDLASNLRICRQVLWWFDVAPDAFASLSGPGMPVYIWIGRDMDDMIYGFPAVDGPAGGIKVSFDDDRVDGVPDGPRVAGSAEEAATVYRERVAGRLRGVSERCLRTVTCHYTMTPDYGFIIDEHPDHERVTRISACSGHGFKHSGAIGEAVAERVLNGTSTIDLSTFAIARLTTPG